MWRILAAAVLALLGACAPQRLPSPAEVRPPPDFPFADYAGLARAGEPVLRIDPARSLVAIEVRRAGALASLGHDHVVASRSVQGFVAPGLGRADLYFALDALVVDDPVLRAEAGFDTTPSAADVAGTRRHMLDATLQSDRYPFATVAVRNAPRVAGTQRIPVEVTLHGVTRSVAVKVDVQADPREFRITGQFSIAQTDFGIVPYSLFGGAIAVRDRVNLSLRLVGHPI